MKAATQDRILVIILALCTAIFAVSLPVNPWPRDGWFASQYMLFASAIGADNYTPVAAPAILYKLTHWLAVLLGLELGGELYVASLVQNVLIFLAAVFMYWSGRLLVNRLLAGAVAMAFLLFVLSTGLPQAFWSENVVLFLFAMVLYLSIRLRQDPPATERGFWWTAAGIGVLTGVLVATRTTPLFLIPGFAILFSGSMRFKRLIGFLTVVASISALLLVAMMAGNYARFGRFEITNSSGRHLWQGVTPMVDQALRNSPEFQALRKLNQGLQGKNHWEVEFPSELRSVENMDSLDPGEREKLANKLTAEEVLGRLAGQAIANEPMLYLGLGLRKFRDKIGMRPYRLGFGERARHFDPLRTDTLLPPLARAWPGLPALAAKGASLVGTGIFRASAWIYPLMVFFLLSTYAALGLSRLGLEHAYGAGTPVGAAVFALAAIALIWIVAASSVVALVLCIALASVQTIVSYRDSTRTEAEGLAIYSFTAFMFVGSLWFSWQIEVANTRNALAYVPFLAMMMCLALSYWLTAVSRVAGRRLFGGFLAEPAARCRTTQI